MKTYMMRSRAALGIQTYIISFTLQAFQTSQRGPVSVEFLALVRYNLANIEHAFEWVVVSMIDSITCAYLVADGNRIVRLQLVRFVSTAHIPVSILCRT